MVKILVELQIKLGRGQAPLAPRLIELILGVKIINRDCMKNRIKLRLKSRNGCYFSIARLFKSKTLYK